MKKTMVSLCLAASFLSVSATSMAAGKTSNLGGGVINFHGSLVNSACSITPETTDQTVDFGVITTKALKDGKSSMPQPFTIGLTNCDTSEANSISVKFIGAQITSDVGGEPGAGGTYADGSLLAVNGVEGVGIAIKDPLGKLVKFDGTETSKMDLIEGTTNLRFTTYVQGLGTAEPTTGEFNATANFMMSYN